MKRIILISGFLLISFFELFSQTNVPARPYLSLNAGGFISARKNFSRNYGSNLGITYGAGIGLPVSSDIYVTGRATYFSKSGDAYTYHYTFDQNGRLVSHTETKDGTAKFTQWLINVGLEGKIPLSETFSLYPAAGITYTKYKEETKSSNSNLSSSSAISGMIGFFGGAGIEKKLEVIPFSVFAEAYYNLIPDLFSDLFGNMGGTNINLGLRYYLPRRNR